MASIKEAFSAAARTAVTVTLASLASSATAGRESAAVDNSSNLYLDALVMLKTKLQAGTPGLDKAVYVYVWGVNDTSAPLYPDVVTGADAAITPNAPIQLRLLGTVYAPTSAGAFVGGPWSVAAAFGGVLPAKWGCVIIPATGIALTATAGDHELSYEGVYATSA